MGAAESFVERGASPNPPPPPPPRPPNEGESPHREKMWQKGSHMEVKVEKEKQLF